MKVLEICGQIALLSLVAQATFDYPRSIPIDGQVKSVAYSPNQAYLGIATTKKFYIRNGVTGNLVHEIPYQFQL